MDEIKRLVIPDRVYNLQKCALPERADDGRDMLRGVHVTPHYAAATDGHVLVKIPFSKSEMERMEMIGGPPPVEGVTIRFVTAKPKPLRREDAEDLLVLELAEDSDCYLVDAERGCVVRVLEGDYAEVGAVIPPEYYDDLFVCIDSLKLEKIRKALDLGKTAGLGLAFQRDDATGGVDEKAGVRVFPMVDAGEPVTAILMPMRMDKPEGISWK